MSAFPFAVSRTFRRLLVVCCVAVGVAHAQDTDLPSTETPVVDTDAPAVDAALTPDAAPVDVVEPGPGDPDACTLTLSGHVRDSFTGEPSADARIVLTAQRPGAASRVTVTDAEGAYAVDALCSGPYLVRVEATEHEPLEQVVNLPALDHLDLALEDALEEVVVETVRLGHEETRAQTTLSGAVLEQTRGENLADAVARVPGVTVLRGTSDNGKPMVRGQYGRRLLLLFDRTRLESQQWGIDHAPEIDPFAAGSISVIKGAAGVRYGPDAIGGVVLVDPRPLREDPGFDGEVHTIGFYNGLRGVAAFRLDGAHAEVPGLAWRVEGNVTKGAAVSSPNYVLGNTGTEQWNAAATLGYRRAAYDLQVSFRHHDLTSGVCYCIASSTPDDFFQQLALDKPVNADLYTTTYAIDRPYQAVSHDLATARLRADVGGVGSLTTSYAFQLNHRQEFEPVRDNITGPQFDFTLRTHTLDLTFAHNPVPISSTVRLEGSVGVTGTFQENDYSGLPLVPNFRAGSVGVFAYERFWHPTFEVEIGARYDHLSQTAFLTGSAYRRHLARGTLADGDCPVGSNDVATCGKGYDAGSVSLGTLVRPARPLTLKLDLSSASRFPDTDELYLNGTAPSFPVYGLGDPSLGVETTWGASLTAELSTPWLSGTASTYVNYIDNYIYFAPELTDAGDPAFDVIIRGAFPRFGYRPVDALYYGFDGGLTLGASWPVQLDVQTSVVRADDVTDGGFLVFIPPDRVAGTLTFKPPEHRLFRDSFIAVDAGYVARQDRVDPKADLAPPPDPYFLLGAAVGTTLHVGDQKVELELRGSHLLNTPYRDYTSLFRYYADEPGRDFRVRISTHFAI